MLGSALYYPSIDIQDTTWLKTAILFWDDIQTISPSTVKEPYQNEETKVCQAEGYLKPLHPDLHGEILDNLGSGLID